ncbi:RNA polymerase sigma-70 factor [Enhygromyxa salina]|uniref:RNA polymerase sigma-70 factor n=1 Tax=Enhygromyxa salina TaxID=215803 RepID=A0A0C2CXJ5_9BACT|nr:RNA polymerase sigma factor [Enhygromyxa salina]KIG12552.1 RNA polymerase sigma-70 factor [Enhygromyxa salina]
MDPDLELFQRWCNGDDAAAKQLVARYFNDLRVYFARRLSELDQEDLVQEVFMRLVAARDRFERRSTVRTFIYSIAKNVYYESLRKLHRPNGTFDPISESLAAVSGRTQSSILAQNEAEQLMLDALESVPSERQELIELHYFHDLAFKELADLFEIPVGTVKSRMSAARDALLAKFMELLGPDGGMWTDEKLAHGLASVSVAVKQGRRRG